MININFFKKSETRELINACQLHCTSISEFGVDDFEKFLTNNECDRQRSIYRMSNVCLQTTRSRRTPMTVNGHTRKENITTVYAVEGQSLISFHIVLFIIAFQSF